MTATLTDRIVMADSNKLSLDELFDRLERMPVPEGYKVEIVEGAIYMSPQRHIHWEIILGIVEQLRAKYPRSRTASDVRIDFPGQLNGFCCDVATFKEGAARDDEGRWRYENVEFVAEVISKSTARNDYGPKKDAFALAGVPVYIIVDPYVGECLLFTDPKDGKYRSGPPLKFGDPIDLTDTVVGLTLATDEFPRD